MLEKFTSERLLQELPRPVINFIWYLWEVYNHSSKSEFYVILQDGGAGKQQFFIPAVDLTISQDFDCNINVSIVIRNGGFRVFMEHYPDS